MGGLKTSLTGRIATQVPLDGNRPAGKGGQHPQVSGKDSFRVVSVFFFYEFYSALVSKGHEKLLLTFTTQRSTIESSHSM